MREHEVPTHVQAEDRVLLWFTFPQVVAITAVCALSYGAYRYAPGPFEARIALAVVIGLMGVAMVVGKIGGRRLPLVVADLLKYRLGARRYAGPVSQLVRDEPPAPVQGRPGPLSLMARRTRRRSRRMRAMARRSLRRLRRSRGRRGERRPFRPHGWFGKRRHRRHRANADRVVTGRAEGSRTWSAVVTAAALAIAVAVAPQAVQADGHLPDEIEFEIPEPVPGRRIFVERLEVSGDTASVTLRAATGLDLRVRAFGGPQGGALRFWGSARLDEGERIGYSLPLSGPAYRPSPSRGRTRLDRREPSHSRADRSLTRFPPSRARSATSGSRHSAGDRGPSRGRSSRSARRPSTRRSSLRRSPGTRTSPRRRSWRRR